MTAIIIGTHGRFSEELLKSSEMIFGKQENIECVTFQPGENADDLVKKYESRLEKLDTKDGVLFLVDLFGGSPFNAASRIAVKYDNMDIVTGVNLPMLLEIFGARSFSKTDELTDVAKTAASQSVKSFKETVSKADNSNNIEEDELE